MVSIDESPEEEPVPDQDNAVVVEGKQWLDGGYLASNLAVVTEEVVAISTKNVIKFVFLRSFVSTNSSAWINFLLKDIYY